MKPYKNLSGDSIVKSFQIYGDGIKLQLSDGSTYVFLYEKSGQEVVEKMKSLAAQGKGLGTFVGSGILASGEKLQ